MFEQFRPVVMGSKFVRVTGKLQSESDVIHIVAEKIEDLTPWLSACSKRLSAISLAQAARQQQMEKERAVSALRQEERSRPAGYRILTREAGSVMPKGRNFQ